MKTRHLRTHKAGMGAGPRPARDTRFLFSLMDYYTVLSLCAEQEQAYCRVSHPDIPCTCWLVGHQGITITKPACGASRPRSARTTEH